MNPRRVCIGVVVTIGLISAGWSPPSAQAVEAANVAFHTEGLQSLSCAGTELLKSGQPRLRRVIWDTGEISIVTGSEMPQATFNEKTRELTQVWNLGRITCEYRPEVSKLNLKITFTNTSNRCIRAVEIGVMALKFPTVPTGPGWYQDLHCTSGAIDDVAAVAADYGTGTFAAVGENVETEYQLVIDKDFDRNIPGYNLLVATVDKEATDFVHADRCRLESGRSATFDISLRFGPTKASLEQMAKDAFAAYARQHPRMLRWNDRRPIAMLMLASVDAQHHSPTNPRGWLNDPRLDVVTPDGKDLFHQRVLGWARRSISQCQKRGAQGVIVWDLEGEEFRPIVYVGDPRMLPQLAPELDEIADPVFKMFLDAGLKTGICIRPSRIIRASAPHGESPWMHKHMGFDPAAEMSEKIRYAKKRWGCSLFYVDTNVTWVYTSEKQERGEDDPESWPMRARLMRKLAQAHPDVLIIPEFQYPGYYSHVSGYKELRGGYASTPQRVLLSYPDAFSVINLSEGKVRERRADLVQAVRRGDILMFRGWFDAAENAFVPSIYRDARQSSSSE